jgi:translation initiation factor 2 subunit 2
MADYDEQLGRALAETPEAGGEDDRFALPSPELRAEGNVTVYENFRETVERLDREGAVVMKFLQAELGTSAHIDESGRARLTGTFAASRVEDAVESFASAYVVCPECGRPDTHLVAEDGTERLRCEACGAVSPAG